MNDDLYEQYMTIGRIQNQHARVKGYTEEHDDRKGIRHLLEAAMYYFSRGEDHKAAGLIVAGMEYLDRNETKNSMQLDIEKFMKACGQEVLESPLIPTQDIQDLRYELISEEINGEKELLESIKNGDLIGIADGIADALYVIIGTASAYGINVKPVFDEVQRSNMTKAVWDDEIKEYKVIRREDGKILKPDTFSAPDLESVIHEQIINAELIEND